MHCSSGSSSGGSNSRRWFWTAAAVTAVTAAATVANASSTTSCKTEASGWTSSKKGSVSATSPAAGGEGRGRESGGCDCGCGGKVNDRHRVNDRHEVNDRHGVSDQPKINDHDHDHQQHQHQQPQHQSRGLPASSGCIADTAAEHPLSPSPSPPAGGAYAGREGAESPLWRSTSRPPELWGEDEHGEEGGPRGVSDLRGGGRALSSIAGAGEQGEGGVGVGGEGEGEGGGGEGGGEDGSKGKSVPLAGRPLFTSVTSTKVGRGEGVGCLFRLFAFMLLFFCFVFSRCDLRCGLHFCESMTYFGRSFNGLHCLRYFSYFIFCVCFLRCFLRCFFNCFLHFFVKKSKDLTTVS